MKIDVNAIKNIDRKMLGEHTVSYYKKHNVTILFLISFFVIGFSLIRIQSLTELASTSASNLDQEISEVDEEANIDTSALPMINLDEATLERLKSIDDTDVIIDSNLPTNRINPF